MVRSAPKDKSDKVQVRILPVELFQIGKKYSSKMDKNIPPTRGGSRQGSGQPKKSPTKVITFRVREEWVAIVKAMVKEKIEQLKKGQV